MPQSVSPSRHPTQFANQASNGLQTSRSRVSALSTLTLNRSTKSTPFFRRLRKYRDHRVRLTPCMFAGFHWHHHTMLSASGQVKPGAWASTPLAKCGINRCSMDSQAEWIVSLCGAPSPSAHLSDKGAHRFTVRGRKGPSRCDFTPRMRASELPTTTTAARALLCRSSVFLGLSIVYVRVEMLIELFIDT
jgi:hypothetical protein